MSQNIGLKGFVLPLILILDLLFFQPSRKMPVIRISPKASTNKTMLCIIRTLLLTAMSTRFIFKRKGQYSLVMHAVHLTFELGFEFFIIQNNLMLSYVKFLFCTLIVHPDPSATFEKFPSDYSSPQFNVSFELDFNRLLQAVLVG